MSQKPNWVLIADCGSASTKAVLLELAQGRCLLKAQGEAPTRPTDLSWGIRGAIAEVEEEIGRVILSDQGIITPAAGEWGVDLFLAVGSGTQEQTGVIRDWLHGPMVPAWATLEKALQVLARGEGNVLGIDLGSASTEVLAVRGENCRSVRTDYGMGSGILKVLAEAGADNILRWLPVSIAPEELGHRIRNKSVSPGSIPHTLEDLLLEQAVAREALGLAWTQAKMSTLSVDLLVGCGGALSQAPRPIQAAMIILDAVRPQGVTRLALDCRAALPQLGILPDLKAQDVEAALVELGTVLAPMGEGAVGDKVITGKVSWAEGSKTIDLNWGDIQLIPGAGPFQVELYPQLGADIGSGGGMLQGELRGGACGLILDCRGDDLALGEDDLTRIRGLLRWYEQVSMYPMLVGGSL